MGTAQKTGEVDQGYIAKKSMREGSRPKSPHQCWLAGCAKSCVRRVPFAIIGSKEYW